MATVAIRPNQVDFYARFLMARAQIDPRHHGIDMDREPFIDEMVGDFNEAYQGRQTIDELLLHPRDALRFCDNVRHKHGYFDLPDDIILRVILQRRKNPPTV
jgi:hypothetical protein